jgi:hypothetical protein
MHAEYLIAAGCFGTKGRRICASRLTSPRLKNGWAIIR